MNDKWYNNIFGTGTNIFGAGPSGSVQSLLDAEGTDGLLNKEDLEKANRRSLMQGLLGTAISYISQPKNQDYGSALPYLGKAFSVGMEQANKPFDDLTNVANMNMKLQDYTDKQTARQRQIEAQALQDQLYTTDADGNPVVNQEAMSKLKVLFPKTYAQYQDIEHKQSEINLNKAKASSEGVADADIKDIDLSLVTPKSKKLYLSPVIDGKENPFYLDKRVLDFNTDERKLGNLKGLSEIQKDRMDVYAKLGQDGLDKFDAGLRQQGIDVEAVKQSDPLNTKKLMNGTPRQPEENFVATAGSVPHHPKNVSLSNGNVVTPTVYNTKITPEKQSQMLGELGTVQDQHLANVDQINKQIDHIHRFLNMGGAELVTGVVSRNTPNFLDKDRANARELLNTIVQKEFLKNYADIKATGGGFGSLSEKEGERLEKMGYALDPRTISEELMVENLNKLLADLEQSKTRLQDGFLRDYGDAGTNNWATFEVTPLQPRETWGSNGGSHNQKNDDILNEADSLINFN